jgi:spoIIIJ-associated protein
LYLSKFTGKVKAKNKEGNKLYLDIFDAGEDAGRLIGKSGQTLSALQTLLRNFVIRKFNESIKVSIDAGEYRSRRFSQLRTKALKAAEKVKTDGKKIQLDPMSPSERRAIHLLFEKNEDIQTLSEGSGHSRRIVLAKR